MISSKSKIDKAGDILRDTPAPSDDALDLLSEWRGRHVYALNLAFQLLKGKTNSKEVGNNAIYGQRLKRVDSIISKLQRFPETNLSRLNDIGGCRVILSSYQKLMVLYSKLKKSRSILPYEKNYIIYPKSDGYRSIHLIYQCGSLDPKYAGLKIELQLRTKLQHAWATTVEIIDLFEGEKLKLGRGSKDWKQFFYLVADAFALYEQLPIRDAITKDELFNKIKILSDKLKVTDKLLAYRHAIRLIDSKTPLVHSKKIKIAKFFILQLMTRQSQIKIIPFSNVEIAQDRYMELEKEFILDPSVNIVMIKSDSVKKIKKSYPNYFADSKLFMETMSNIMKD